MTQILVIGINGSLREKSMTRHALNLALAGASRAGAEVRLLELREYELAFCDGRKDESTYPTGVFQLRQDVQAAHGVILGTPEYHGGMSGVLKNALDLMSFEEFEGKTVGLLGVAGGTMGGVNALNHLRVIGRSLHAWVVPSQVAIPRAWEVFEKDGTPKDDRIAERLHDLGREVAQFAFLHNSGQVKEFLRAWENAPSNPGGQ